MSEYALVAFGAGSRRPTIICILEAALPEVPGADWMVLARDSELDAAAPQVAPGPRSDEHEA